MPRPKLEVADIFRSHGDAYRRDHAGHLNLPQLKVMSAIETCRTATLGGHISACTKCGHQHIAYNSCRNRHCPKCQGATARDWMQARMEDLLPVEYFHVVFTLPAPIADVAYHNKAAVYGLLFKASAQTLLTIAADPKHLGARIGMTSVLHTWGSAMTHHPHVHVIVPGGGLSLDGTRWIGCRPGFFLPVKVLSRLFRRLFLEGLVRLHKAGELKFFGDLSGLADPDTFATHLAPLRKTDWVVYAKLPFGGPEAVLAYLSRYTHRVAISIDPACGSGHFLLAAARRIATRLARIRAEGTPSLADFRHALRDVARCCIHGVDRNPMAVELTKVALWIETVDPDLPLGFFDAQIRCGDALLGVFGLQDLEDARAELRWHDRIQLTEKHRLQLAWYRSEIFDRGR